MKNITSRWWVFLEWELTHVECEEHHFVIIITSGSEEHHFTMLSLLDENSPNHQTLLRYPSDSEWLCWEEPRNHYFSPQCFQTGRWSVNLIVEPVSWTVWPYSPSEEHHQKQNHAVIKKHTTMLATAHSKDKCNNVQELLLSGYMYLPYVLANLHLNPA